MDRRNRRSAPVLAVAAALLLSACHSGGRVVLPVAFEAPAPAATLRYPEDFVSHEATVRGVAAILSRQLGLPVPDQVTVYIYGSRAIFEQGLVTDGRLPAVRRSPMSFIHLALSTPLPTSMTRRTDRPW